ncbi:unnamed protein product [Urochloa humidicola]
MAGSTPLGDGRTARGTDSNGPSRTRPASPVMGVLPGRPRLTASKKRRSMARVVARVRPGGGTPTAAARARSGRFCPGGGTPAAAARARRDGGTFSWRQPARSLTGEETFRAAALSSSPRPAALFFPTAGMHRLPQLRQLAIVVAGSGGPYKCWTSCNTNPNNRRSALHEATLQELDLPACRMRTRFLMRKILIWQGARSIWQT